MFPFSELPKSTQHNERRMHGITQSIFVVTISVWVFLPLSAWYSCYFHVFRNAGAAAKSMSLVQDLNSSDRHSYDKVSVLVANRYGKGLSALNSTSVLVSSREGESVLEQVKLFVKGCKNIYLDLGSNRGVHIRWLFDAQEYQQLDQELRAGRGPENLRRNFKKTECLYTMFKRFDRWFGSASFRSQPFNSTGICALGFEANPALVGKARSTGAHYECKGIRAKVFAPVAVWVENGETAFSEQQSSVAPGMGVGGSRMTAFMENDVKRKYRWKESTVPTVDIAQVLLAIQKHSDVARFSGIMAGKMDIEGSEKKVLPYLRQKGLLCAKSGLEFLTMETHGGFSIKGLNLQHFCEGTRATAIENVDCEVFGNDPLPLMEC